MALDLNVSAGAEQGIGTGLAVASPALNFVPYVGPLLSAAAAVGSGFLEKDAARRQQEQAANLRNQASALTPEALSPNLQASQQARNLAAQSNMPGLEFYKNALSQAMAGQIRAIHQNSPNGARAVNAISLLYGQQNDALGKLGAQNAQYRGTLGAEARQGLYDTGIQQRALQLFRDQERDKIFGQANNLDVASTTNKLTGGQTILGALGSTGADIFKNLKTSGGFNATAAGRKYPNYPQYGGVGQDDNYNYTPAADDQNGGGAVTLPYQNQMWDSSGAQFSAPSS